MGSRRRRKQTTTERSTDNLFLYYDEGEDIYRPVSCSMADDTPRPEDVAEAVDSSGLSIEDGEYVEIIECAKVAVHKYIGEVRLTKR